MKSHITPLLICLILILQCHFLIRVLYEVGPLAHLVEMAGGKANDGVNSLMELEVTSHDQRSAIIAGSAKEVEWVVETLNKGTN